MSVIWYSHNYVTFDSSLPRKLFGSRNLLSLFRTPPQYNSTFFPREHPTPAFSKSRSKPIQRWPGATFVLYITVVRHRCSYFVSFRLSFEDGRGARGCGIPSSLYGIIFRGGVMKGWMDITSSWVITRFAEMPAGRLGHVMLEVDGVGLFGWLLGSSW